VGWPPLVIELIRDQIIGTDNPPVDLRSGPETQSPSLSEPAAVAVGLRHAGVDIPLRLLVEASRPLYEGLPERIAVTEVSGTRLVHRSDWNQVVEGWEITRTAESRSPSDRPMVEFATDDGRIFSTPGPGLPYGRIDILDLAPIDLDAGILAPLKDFAPVSWLRELSLGSSHGMMVALMTYADASGNDLAQGRHIAGTGGIRGDGRLTRIGGLPAKARAAKRAGADVLLFPASQVGQLETFDREGITLVPVTTLEEAIAWLANPVA